MSMLTFQLDAVKDDVDLQRYERCLCYSYVAVLLIFIYIRCLKMCLVHDMAESIVGDLTPHCGVSVEDKHRQEEEAMETLIKLVPAIAAAELKRLHNSTFTHVNIETVLFHSFSLFLEYEKQETKEAVLVKDLDRFDMIVQAFEYEESRNKPLALQEFFNATEGLFKHPTVKRWVEELLQKRANSSSPATSESTEPASASPEEIEPLSA